MKRRRLAALAITVIGAVAATAWLRRPFDWREEMPPDFRLVEFTPSIGDLQAAWIKDDDNRPRWEYRVPGTIDEIERRLLTKLGSEWFRTKRWVQDHSPYLILRSQRSQTRPGTVEVYAVGESHPPTPWNRWAADHLPLSRWGLAQDASYLCIFRSGRQEIFFETRIIRREP